MQKRDCQVKFRMTADERALLDARMQEAGYINLGAYLRQISLTGHILKLNVPELKEMISQLKHIGNNLNQLTKRVNSGGQLVEGELSALTTAQQQLWDSMNQLIIKLSEVQQEAT